MIRLCAIALACSVLGPALAGPSAAAPPIALTASPARLALPGPGRAAIEVRNAGRRPIVLDVSRAGFRLDLRGRPRIAPRRRGDPRLTMRPSVLALAPGASKTVAIEATLPRRAEPGDHDAVVLLTTRPRRAAGVAVRMRIGVVVVVRAPGRIVRRLELRRLHARKANRVRVFELLVVNRGNVTETLHRRLVSLTLLRRGKALVRLRPRTRQFRPRTRGLVEFPYRGSLRGWVRARASISFGDGLVARRTFRIRL